MTRPTPGEPPFILDGARVLHYAVLDMAGAARNRPSGMAGGVPLEGVRGVIVASHLLDDSVFAMFCNERWETLAATPHPDPAAAREACARALDETRIDWREFRPLTAAETSEMETTRAFLRSLEDELPE